MRISRFLYLLTLLVPAAFAQNGSIAGSVLFPGGEPFVGAVVQAKNSATGAELKATTAAGGKYNIANVPAGKYDVTVNMRGVLPATQKDVMVTAAKTTDVNIRLREGTQLSTLGEDALGAIADAKLHKPPTGPTPRTPDGKPDLSGVWWRPAVTDPGKPEWLPNAVAVANQRRGNNNADSPMAHCLPSAITRMGPLFQFSQKRDAIIVINDDESPGFHQIRMNRTAHPKEPDFDLWYGDSIGRWEDDTLVVDRVTFKDEVWLDEEAHPHSDKLHVIERFRRPDMGHLERTVIVEDPGVLAKPWTMKQVSDLAAGEEIREFICAENNRDVPHLVGK